MIKNVSNHDSDLFLTYRYSTRPLERKKFLVDFPYGAYREKVALASEGRG